MAKRTWPRPMGYHWDRAEKVVLPCGSKPCRWCKGPITARRRQTFCSDACVDRWKERSDPAIFRRLAYERDKGTCRACGLDLATVDYRALKVAFRRVPEAGRPEAMKAILAAGEWQLLNDIGDHHWEIDHIIPLVEGGDFFDPANLRLLCLPCHKAETAALARRRASKRRAARHGIILGGLDEGGVP